MQPLKKKKIYIKIFISGELDNKSQKDEMKSRDVKIQLSFDLEILMKKNNKTKTNYRNTSLVSRSSKYLQGGRINFFI